MSIELRLSSLELLHWALQMNQQCFWQHLTHAPEHEETLLLGHSAVSMHESIHQAVCSPTALLGAASCTMPGWLFNSTTCMYADGESLTDLPDGHHRSGLLGSPVPHPVLGEPVDRAACLVPSAAPWGPADEPRVFLAVFDTCQSTTH